MTDANPFDRPFDTPFGAPPFKSIAAAHYMPAFLAAFAAHRAEIDAIAANPEAPSFANTIEAMERSGEYLTRVSSVFGNLAGAMSDEPLREIERELAPIGARHDNAIMLDPRLFARIDAVFKSRETAGLNAEQLRLVERTHKNFARAGAGLSQAERDRVAAINERLASLGTSFSQNVLKDEADFMLLLDGADDLAGLSDDFLSGAAAMASERGHPGKHAVGLSRGAVEAFLTQSTRRDLREKLLSAFLKRGENHGPTDNREVIAETLRLRAERSRIMGYKTYADFKLDDTMAETPAAVYDLIDQLWRPGRAQALRDRDRLQELVQDDGGNYKIAAHDWRYFAEKQRRADYAIDDAELRPYFTLDRMIEAAFHVANKLFGLSFSEIKGAETYHPDVRAFEAKDASGKHVALFYGDYFARPSKHGGAWMSGFRGQRKLDGDQRPIIVNVLNIAKPAEGAPALLSITEASTLFHEFGHALHGMLSDVTYPSLAGTAVSTDFVELPSQLYEHWLVSNPVLKNFARHVETGEPMPDELIARLRAAKLFNQGFANVEFLTCAYVDMDAHMKDHVDDMVALENETLQRLEAPVEIPMRHRSGHFSHAFGGEHYAAGYYSYLWSAVLDEDAFAAFEEAGDVFDPATAKRLRDYIYSAGNLRDPKEAYIGFRGRLPRVEPLLKARGLN